MLRFSRFLLGAFFVAAGIYHFVRPELYTAIVPASLPRPALLVAISGAAEIAGGVGVFGARTRKAAGFGLIALLIAVFPANISATIHGMNIAGKPVPPWLLWARLPLQGVLIWWVWNACWKTREHPRWSAHDLVHRSGA
ncbi:MAG: DoxX family membrane protein [Verrucomicrobiota bacterium]|nr:DoxX family membrane protein [Verrucomicrobiota bacterium]